MIFVLSLICLVLSVCVGYLMKQLYRQQKQIWSVEQEQRRIWQFIQRGQTGTVSEKSNG